MNTKSSYIENTEKSQRGTESFFSFFSPCVSVQPLCISVFLKTRAV